MPIAPSSHLTSCIFIRGSCFAKNNNKNAAVCAVMAVVGDRFARFLAPNFVVQTAGCGGSVDDDDDDDDDDYKDDAFSRGVTHKELSLFFHRALGCGLVMAFVFKAKVHFVAPAFLAGRESRTAFRGLFECMHAGFHHMISLDLVFDERYSEIVAMAPRSSPLRSAVILPNLPPSLESLSLQSTGVFTMWLDQHDVLLLSAMPYLRRLRCDMSVEGLVEMFKAAAVPVQQTSDSDSAEQGQHEHGKNKSCCSFFPNLRTIEGHTMHQNFFDIVKVASCGRITTQLDQFALRPVTSLFEDSFTAVTRCAVGQLTHALLSLGQCRSIGDFCLAPGLVFDAPLDLATLEDCLSLGNSFLRSADVANCVGHSDYPDTLDLSELRSLRRLGSHALCSVSGARRVILPASIQRIGSHFMADGAKFEEIDFAALPRLRSIDLSSFGQRSLFQRVDTSPLLGKTILGDCRHFLRECETVVEVNLSGLAHVAPRLGEKFLCGATSLQKVLGMEALARCEFVDSYFLANTRSLVSCDFYQMISLKQVGEYGILAGSALAVHGKEVCEWIMEKNKSKRNF